MAISSFTMFFEIGTVSGGILLGTVAELAGKRACFAAAVVHLRRRPLAAAHPGRPGHTGSDDDGDRSAIPTRHGIGCASRHHGWVIDLELAVRQPFAADHLVAFLAARAVPGIEAWDGSAFHRALDLPHGHGVAVITPTRRRASACRLRLADGTTIATPRCGRIRRLLDLDADPDAVDDVARRRRRARRRWCDRLPGSACPAASTRSRPPCGQSSASRSPSPGRAPSPAGSSLQPARR